MKYITLGTILSLAVLGTGCPKEEIDYFSGTITKVTGSYVECDKPKWRKHSVATLETLNYSCPPNKTFTLHFRDAAGKQYVIGVENASEQQLDRLDEIVKPGVHIWVDKDCKWCCDNSGRENHYSPLHFGIVHPQCLHVEESFAAEKEEN